KFGTQFVLDDDRYSYYASDDAVLNPTLEITLPKAQEFDIIRLRENIKLGQRLDSVAVEVFENGSWKHLAQATSIGANRLIRLEQPVTATKLRIQLFAPVAPTLSDFGLFKEFKEDFKFDKTVPAKVKLSTKDFKLQDQSFAKAVDGNAQTFAESTKGSEGVVFVLKKAVSAIGYLPRQDGQKEGMVTKFTLLISDNNKDWQPYREGEFSNIQANPIEQVIYFGEPLQTKYIKFVSDESVGQLFTAAEITLYQ